MQNSKEAAAPGAASVPFVSKNERMEAIVFWLVLAGFTLAWFAMLGMRTLVPTDEGRYAQMAREMMLSGDWITPRLNGIKYFEKPPLQTWMNALTFEAFGLGEWQARLWTGLCGFFGIALTAYAGRRVFGYRAGIYAGLVLGSCLFWNALGHINTLDMGLSAMMTLSLCSLLIAQHAAAGSSIQRKWMLLCWVGMGLAILSKGLIGMVLPGAVLVLYTALSRDWAIWKRLYLVQGLALLLAVTAPWFILVSLKNPEFARFFFIHEHFERFLTKTHNRAGPWYYFIPLLLAGMLPWLGALPKALFDAVRVKPDASFNPRLLLLVWATFIFFFFSISGSKLPSYILPIFPALALLIGTHLDTASRKSWLVSPGLLIAVGIAGLALSTQVAQMSKTPMETPLYQQYQGWIVAAAVTALIGGALTMWILRRGRYFLASLSLSVAGFFFVQLLMLGHEPFGRYASGLLLVPSINAELKPDTPLYMVGMYNQTLPYYLQRTVTLVEHPDEFEFGLKQQPELWLPNRAAFIEKWVQGPKAVAITTPDRYAELLKAGLPMRVVAQDSRRVVITNDLQPAGH